MGDNSPVFMLEVANALISEVRENTNATLEAIRNLANRDTSQGGFLSSIADSWKAGKAQQGLLRELRKNLTLAIELCGKAHKVDPAASTEEGDTVHTLTAQAFFQQGMISFAINDIKGALKMFEDSLKYSADQTTLFNIALCYAQMPSSSGLGMFGKSSATQDPVALFQKCIDMDPESDMAISAGKELARLGKL